MRSRIATWSIVSADLSSFLGATHCSLSRSAYLGFSGEGLGRFSCFHGCSEEGGISGAEAAVEIEVGHEQGTGAIGKRRTSDMALQEEEVGGIVERIGTGDTRLVHDGPAGKVERNLGAADHAAGLEAVIELAAGQTPRPQSMTAKAVLGARSSRLPSTTAVPSAGMLGILFS